MIEGRPAESVFVALGSNLGDRRAHLGTARQALARLPMTTLVASSSIEETAPLGGRRQPTYLNQMVLLETHLDPQTLLEACHVIERAAGRVRRDRWGSRTLDVDIVRFGDRTIRNRRLTIPHPGLPERPFWHREIAELESHAR